eukprot:2814024-Pyramimonas_sp.AAC.1
MLIFHATWEQPFMVLSSAVLFDVRYAILPEEICSTAPGPEARCIQDPYMRPQSWEPGPSRAPPCC